LLLYCVQQNMVRLAESRARLLSLLAAVALVPCLMQAQAPAAAPQGGKSASVTAQPTKQASQPHHSSKRNKKVVEPEVQAPPPPPPTPEQMAPAPPNVSYQGGQLTIDSKNATLAQVLRSVQNKTGASIEVPASAGNERVVAQLGPGRPSDVIAALLQGSKFDYIILGVANQPGAVQKLILTTRQSGGTSNTAQNHAPQPPPQEEPQPEEDYAQPEPAQVEENSPAEVPGQQPGGPAGMYRPGMPPGQSNQNAEFPSQSPPDQQGPQQQQGVKTPEQLLQELQRVQQQQQMYQQQLNPANQNPPQQ
jgi:hypothetical protein